MDIASLRSSLLFPAVTRLNLSQNELISIPSSISLLDNLGTLILRDNAQLKEVCFLLIEFINHDYLLFRFHCPLVQCKNYGILIFMVVVELLKNKNILLFFVSIFS